LSEEGIAAAASSDGGRRPGAAAPLVLVIDDTEEIALFIQAILESAGYQVQLAANGADGLQKVLDRTPALIILDLQMPEIDGIGVLRRLKARPPYDEIPVVVLSANQALDDVTAACTLGAKDYMTKPFKPEDLVAKVAKHIRPARGR
jgi:DNA-binding response OmpR family regulator